jgi:hypothetical protein
LHVGSLAEGTFPSKTVAEILGVAHADESDDDASQSNLSEEWMQAKQYSVGVEAGHM